jgi:hypothetical protein
MRIGLVATGGWGVEWAEQNICPRPQEGCRGTEMGSASMYMVLLAGLRLGEAIEEADCDGRAGRIVDGSAAVESWVVSD